MEADRWHRGRADDRELGAERGGSVGHDDGVTDSLVQLGQGGRAEDDLLSPFDLVARQNGGRELGVGAAEQRGDYLAVELDVEEADRGPRGNARIVVQERPGLRGVSPGPPVAARA